MKKVLTEYDIETTFRKGEKIIHIQQGDIITPLAKDRAKELNIKIETASPSVVTEKINPPYPQNSKWKKVFIGGDHTGFKVRNFLIDILTTKGLEINNVGSYDENACDYPDFAISVAKSVMTNSESFGVLVDATGIPSAITANKIKGIRAATCYNEFSAKSAREHNNANVIVLGAKTLGEETIRSIIETWLKTDFAGGRHQRRLDKISDAENQK